MPGPRFACALLLAWPVAEAHAASIDRCVVRLDRGVGALEIAGHGATPEAAWRSAERLAASVAALDDLAELLGGLLTDPEPAMARYLDRLEAPGGPGSFERGACERLRLPRNREGHAWEATWSTEDSRVLRGEPAVALDAARRRGCFGAFQRAAHEALARRYSERPWRDVVVALADARDDLLRCVAAPSLLPRPWAAPEPAIERDGVWVCHRPRRSEGRWALSPGYGHSLEVAREAALTRDVLIVTRRAAAALMEGRLAAQDTEALHAALDPMGTLVVGNDGVEKTVPLCAVAPEAQVDFAWAVPERCGAEEAPFSVRASVPVLERLAGPRCDGVLRAGMEATARRLTGTGDVPQALAGFGASLRCAASCSTDPRIRGWEPTPMVRPGDVDRTTAERAAAALEVAVAERDLPTFGALTGGVMLHPRYVQAEQWDSQAFWGSLQEIVREGRLSEVARWEPVAGQWLLTFEE